MRAGNGSSRYAARLGVVIAMLVILTGAGCGGDQHEPSGAAIPARPGSQNRGTAVSGGPSVSGSAPGSVDDTPAAATRTVEGYFHEINEAARAGRVAVIAPTALGGCQPCALDVGVTRSLQQRGLRADGPAYQLSDVLARPRVGLVTEVDFTVRTRAVGLLDPAGRRVSDAPAVPTRVGTAELSLTDHGWRIQTLRYAPAQA
ncbi:hypothetical protein CcI156_16610 [Frankia sp. CcI156]|uniref:hypothetical protein n=2 Tax=Frankiaceae TaxID=74712 RepID=UPI0003CFAE4F|nr:MULTISPECIES: hypothetical protein [Frankia]KEZ36346.1 hypothetical protein CEDDRAFT_02202 [Frankia sp. CeD]ETA00438.1 hypothetical protein CcI6DRAFT_04125 [Frankia sp. CcI6]KDA42306.1 hypothetical protein BMG523Draft_02823 [Frankia sp. BMG5.23]OAA21643.1 hypothetical protein AAY23_10735 [Frankia casuarinae]OFB42083.1 hypothetical protein Manayef4_15815 [Frankia sp. CgIM4]